MNKTTYIINLKNMKSFFIDITKSNKIIPIQLNINEIKENERIYKINDEIKNRIKKDYFKK